MSLEFGKVSKKRNREEIESERRQEELKVHDLHKRQRIDAL